MGWNGWGRLMGVDGDCQAAGSLTTDRVGLVRLSGFECNY